MHRVTFADIDREMGVFGAPEYCVERVRALRAIRMDQFICYFNQGRHHGPRHGETSMTLSRREVMPHCR